MHHADRLATMALIAGQGPAETAIKGIDGGVEDPSGGIEMARTKGVGIARQAGAGEL